MLLAQCHLALVWAAMATSALALQMPYNPTRILRNGTTLYVFQPSQGSSSQFQLGAIDISSKIATASVPYTTLYPNLPFLDANEQQAFTPVLDNGGNITVFTGNCSQGASGAKIWNFMPEKVGKVNGTWSQQSTNFDSSGKHNTVMGANYLNAGMAFSSLVGDDTSNTSAYFFGGMCPYSSNQDSWQSSANYSNYMITLDPTKDGAKSLNYKLGTSSSRGPPISEAGFTLTGLQPSYSNRSDGRQTQQRDYVLIGGHTSAAFINMSQVAVFSLPQQGWTFVPVSQPNTQRTDLSIRTDVDQIDPRSGHSAVLAPDGQRIIIFGGWVGDPTTPADPLLAVLNIGDSGTWEWTVPTTSGQGLASNGGIYGHGAAMLPGGVMMISGGYSISSSSSRRRGADATTNSKTLFFNVTSNTWTTDYVPPPDVTSSPSSSSGPLSSPSQKAGLGVGLGIGMASVLGLMVFYIWYTRRLKRQRDEREKQLHDLAMGAHRYNLECLTPGVDGRGGQPDAGDYFDDANSSYFYPAAGNGRAKGWRQANGHEAERTGLLVEIPSPTRGLRRSLGGRPAHQMARYDDRRVRGSGHIHPIDELDEEADHEATDKTPLTSQPEMGENPKNQGASIFRNAPVLDPFVDGHSRSGSRADQVQSHARSAPASPEHGESSNSRDDWHLAVGTQAGRSSPNSTGRTSPDKSERTGSNLSERSQRSNLSSNSGHGSLGRTTSMRSTILANLASTGNPFKTPDASPISKGNRSPGGWESPIDPRTRSFTSVQSYRPTTAEERDSFTTARTSFMQLQVEGEALLGGNPDKARPNTASSSSGSHSHGYQDTDPSMSRAGTITAATSIVDGPTRPRRKSWLGSVRRALARASTTEESRTRSLTTSTPQLERYTDNPPSPTPQEDYRKSFPASTTAPPRRAASDASFWRSKRGRQDWLDEEMDPNDPGAKWRRNSGDDWGAPEDVVYAEKQRQRREWRQRSTLIDLADHHHDLAPPRSRTPLGGLDLGEMTCSSSSGVEREREREKDRDRGKERDRERERERDRPSTPADEGDWDVEAAIERRVVQVMFTVPKSKLRVVNADVERASILSLPRENSDEALGLAHKPSRSDLNSSPVQAPTEAGASPSGASSPSRVKDLVGRFEKATNTPSSSSVKSLPSLSPRNSPRMAPSPSPSPSIKSLRLRARESQNSLTVGKRGSEASLRSVNAGSGSSPLAKELGRGKGKGKGKERLVSEDITSMDR